MIDLDILWAKHTNIFGKPIDNLGQLSTPAGFFIFFLYVHGGGNCDWKDNSFAERSKHKQTGCNCGYELKHGPNKRPDKFSCFLENGNMYMVICSHIPGFPTTCLSIFGITDY